MILAARDHREAVFCLIDTHIDNRRTVGDFQHLGDHTINISRFLRDPGIDIDLSWNNHNKVNLKAHYLQKEKEMKKFTGAVVISAVALLGGAVVGVPAHAADPATVVLSGGSAVFGLDPASIVATASVPGTVKFSAAGVGITDCDAVATAATTPFVAKCAWKPLAAGKTALTATLTPTDLTIAKVDANVFNVTVGVPVQGVVSPINMYVDEVLATGSTGVLAPYLGGGCAKRVCKRLPRCPPPTRALWCTALRALYRGDRKSVLRRKRAL